MMIAHASLDAASTAAATVVDSDTRKELEALLAESNAALAVIEKTQQVRWLIHKARVWLAF